MVNFDSIFKYLNNVQGYSDGSCSRVSLQLRRHRSHRFDPWVRKIPLEEEMATHSSILA